LLHLAEFVAGDLAIDVERWQPSRPAISLIGSLATTSRKGVRRSSEVKCHYVHSILSL
jgi:hypothetical protein